MRTCRLLLALALLGSALSSSRTASATNVTEFPDNGSEQMGRGGAWVARASDPLATIFNPAGLAGQPTRLTLQNNLIFHHTCFTRVRAANDTTQDLTLVGPDGRYPRVCNDVEPNINPQLGATLRLTDRVGLGLLIIGPSAAGEKNWPDFVNDANGEPQAAPQRYLLARQSGIVLFPTVGIGVQVLRHLRLGASFSWGIAKLKLASATMALNTDSTTSANDVRANLQVRDYFIPGFTLGGLYELTPEIDLGAWYKWSDAIRASGDVGTAANYYTRANAQGDDRNVRYGDTIFEDCGTGLPTTECGSGNNARVRFAQPMEAKLGVRYHKPRSRLPAWYKNDDGGASLRDPMATDLFDIEANLTWANNSAIDAIQVRFPGDETGKGRLPVAGVQGGEIPPNADQPRNYRDVFGLRVGGDVNVLPDQLALRAGGFFETSAADSRYQNIDFAPSARFGLSLGATYRIKVGREDQARAIDVMVGYGHVFFVDQTRTDPNASGLPALAGTSCNASDPVSPEKCSDGTDRYRSRWPVNLGTITNALNVINVGLAYRF
jgi:long-subunit fatty acid transport protein